MSEGKESIDAGKAADGWQTAATARKLYACHKFDCDFETFEPRNKCPKCGFPVYDMQTFKLLGGLLCVLGGILALGGLALIVFVSFRLGAGGGKAILVHALFAGLTLAGLAVLAGGLKQAFTGYKSPSFMRIFVGLLLIMAVIGAIARLVVGLV